MEKGLNQKIGLCFKRSIQEICKREESDIPSIVVDCCKELNKRGGNYEGIYRVPGNVLFMKDLIAKYDKGKKNLDLSKEHVTTLSSVLKQFLRELETPVIPYDMYNDMVNLFPTEQLSDFEVKLKFVDYFQNLPRPNRLILKVVLSNLYKMSREPYVSTTLMTGNKLSAIMGQNILRPPNPMFFIKDMGKIQLSFRFMINNYPLIKEKIGEDGEKDPENLKSLIENEDKEKKTEKTKGEDEKIKGENKEIKEEKKIKKESTEEDPNIEEEQ